MTLVLIVLIYDLDKLKPQIYEVNDLTTDKYDSDIDLKNL